ncbi:MAG TPA: hypothetical protein VKB23_10435 [Solirubrobacterales bacterium]|nr:hypothetical protein [Solirubrobacterales bacterium]
MAAPAGAVDDSEELGRFGSTGSAAGQVRLPLGLDTSPATGRVYAADLGNRRIDEFTAFGEFVRAWGWGVIDGKNELQVCSASCRQGLSGSGAGQLADPQAVAVDPSGNVYVREFQNNRVQKFSSSGEFILAFGGGVDKTTGGDVCTAASGDDCGAGAAGSGPGEFAAGLDLAAGPAGTIFVPGPEGIMEFEADGNFKTEITVPGETAKYLDLDPLSGNIYAVFGTISSKDDVFELSPSGTVVDSLVVDDPRSVATGPTGNLFVVEGADPALERPERVLEFSPSKEQVSSFAVPPLRSGSEGANGLRLELKGLGTNSAGDLYVSNALGTGAALPNENFIRAFGPPPVQFEPPPPAVPTIVSQYPVSVGVDRAVLRSEINPHFWQDATYYVEYGTGSCAAGGCPQKLPIPPGALTSQAVDKAVTSGNVALPGLLPGTTYHFRFVSESGGGGPVYGIDPDGEGPEEPSAEDGAEGTFRTFAEVPAPPCANGALRSGPSALLPDCRAYEMVSPVDKANGDIVALIDVTGYETRLNQSSLDGGRLTYSSYRAFGDSGAAPYTSQYLGVRGPGGWSGRSLGEPRGPSFYTVALAGNEFKAFSPDLCQSWQLRDAEPRLAEAAVEGFPNLYRRTNCGVSATYEALSTVEPPNLPPTEYAPDFQGHSADGSRVLFRIDDKLTDDATAGKYQLYEASEGQLKLVCILPGGSPAAGDCSAGSPPSTENETAFNRRASVDNAISEDGSRVYWSASSTPVVPGSIYLRIDGSTTVEVSGKATSAESRFWGAAPDGSSALFTVEDQSSPITLLDRNLYRYELATETATKLAGKVVGVVATSEDLSLVYFVSEEAIGGEGTAGKANLYLRDGDGVTFIATLSSEDVRRSNGARLPSVATEEPIYHAAQATPDGRRLAFISTAPLTGFDNSDLDSGEADSEVFTYAADTGTLDCASCSPAGARPAGRRITAQANEGSLWTAASIPVWETQLYAPRALSEDGSRLFFTAYADLLPRDTNGRADVYEWELPGTGSCEEADSDHFAANGGCIYLISTGTSPQDSEFLDADSAGDNVFFGTKESLLAQDPGLTDIYVARVGGGLPPAPSPAPPCLGEACQPQTQAPTLQAPGSNVPRSGNPPKRPPCPKGKHRVKRHGKVRCVKHRKGRNRNHSGQRHRPAAG